MNPKQMEAGAKLLTVLLIAVVAYVVLHKLFGKSKTDKQYLAEASDPGSAFGVTFWRNYIYVGSAKPNGRKPVTQEQIDRLKKAADNAYNAFGYFSDDESRFFSALRQCYSKAEVSLMAYLMAQKHNNGLIDRMKSGAGILPENGLNETEMQQAISYVNSLKTV